MGDPARPNANDSERLAFAIPPIDDPSGSIDPDFLDPSDPDERALLIRAAHPELGAAIADGRETAVVEGQEINPRLHLAIHEVVANQLIGGDPPEVWATAQRLRKLGYDRHEVLRGRSPRRWARAYNDRLELSRTSSRRPPAASGR